MKIFNRRNFLRSSALLSASAALPSGHLLASENNPSDKRNKVVLRIAHITDVHLPIDVEIHERYKQCLERIKQHKVDFILNGGDSVMDVADDNMKRENVIAQWDGWDICNKSIEKYEVYSCIGNHDSWWAAPTKNDDMYGKDYAVKRLKIPNRYYAFSKKGWRFIILDGNNKDTSIDDEQYEWLETELHNLPAETPVLLMSHFPILGTTALLVGGGHSDRIKLKSLFYKHRDKVRICLSGHQHLLDTTLYNGVKYCCNGAMSGFWWEKGNKDSAGPYYNYETPPGYAILDLYSDGSVENKYIIHGF